jgi:hypothetical protein
MILLTETEKRMSMRRKRGVKYCNINQLAEGFVHGRKSKTKVAVCMAGATVWGTFKNVCI